jgi:hypothetical protein
LHFFNLLFSVVSGRTTQQGVEAPLKRPYVDRFHERLATNDHRGCPANSRGNTGLKICFDCLSVRAVVQRSESLVRVELSVTAKLDQRRSETL